MSVASDKWYRAHREYVLVRQKVRYRAKRDQILAYTKAWNQRPEVRARKVLSRRREHASRYGLDVETYNMLRQRPCEICGKVTDTSVDHNHRTGQVRGTLCRPCNSAIGMLCDDPERVRAALGYLENKWDK